MRSLVVVAISLSVWSGCKKKQAAEPSPTATASPSPSGAGASATPSASPDDKIPPLPEWAGGTYDAAARKLNAEGLELHKAKDYQGSRAKFVASVKAAPEYVMSRYNLACAENLLGNDRVALDLLAEFKRPGCAACLARLVRAREDSDWDSQKGKPRFEEITGGVATGDDKLAQLARKLDAEARKNETKVLASVVNPKQPVEVRNCFEADQMDEPCKPDVLTGFDKVKEAVPAGDSYVELPVNKVLCLEGCCVMTFKEGPDDFDKYSHAHWVSEWCFGEVGGKTVLKRFVPEFGGI